MSSFRTFIRTLVIATACAFAFAPTVANAQDKPASPRVEKVGKRHHGKVKFPLEPAKFSEIIDKKIEVARAQMELALTASTMTDTAKAQIRKDFDAAAAKVRTAAKDAGKDGKITKDEAKDVRHQARSLAKELREKHGGDKKGDKKREKRD